MFIKKPLKATKPKHIVYLITTSVLGILINYFVLAAIQFLLILMHSDKNVVRYGGYPPYLIFLIGFLLLGALWGFAAGRYWWRIIYVEHKYSSIK
ncbi:MAG: hypothetical protein M1155_01380 [Patescibacteria group bacterium]|nr:hypothetical protein [Patescibacteria group bacterium]